MAKNSASEAVDAALEAAEAASKAARAAAQNGVNHDAEDDVPKLGALFQLDGDRAAQHVKTRVWREEPIEEGHLGDLGSDATEDDIRRRWGGGTFRIQATTETGKILSQRGTVKVAGEPLFDNEVARRRYKKWLRDNGLLEDDTREVAAPVQTSDAMAIEEARHRRDLERIRAESEARASAAKAEADAAITRMRLELAEREAADERKRRAEREEREDERKRERDEARLEREAAAEKEERRWKQEREERRLERESAEAKEQKRWESDREERRLERERAADPVALMMKGIEIAAGLRDAGGGDGFPDAGTAFVAKMPEIIEGARGLLGDAVVAGAAKQTNPAPASARARPVKDDEEVRLDPVMSKKVLAVAKKLQQQGKDPGKIMSAEFDRALNRMATTSEVKDAKVEKPKALPAAKPKKQTKK